MTVPFIQNRLHWNEGREYPGFEFPLFTDVHVTGETSIGPYSFFQTFAPPSQTGRARVAMIVRCQVPPIVERLQQPLETRHGGYRGGDFLSEIAAITSLFTGARFRAGDESRVFGQPLARSPEGKPWYWSEPPTLSAIGSQGPIVPDAMQARNLDLLNELSLVRRLKLKHAISFVRAARLYADALWIAEGQPALAWLMFVSAIEALANRERSTEKYEATMNASFPELMAALFGNDLQNIRAMVVETFGPISKSREKFLNFCSQYLPAPPTERPRDFLRVEWSPNGWNAIAKLIYGYRSKALHEGIPFPEPMCRPPFQFQGDPVPSERGTEALAVGAHGGKWTSDTLPTNLNIFAQFTRTIILNWLAMQA